MPTDIAILRRLTLQAAIRFVHETTSASDDVDADAEMVRDFLAWLGASKDEQHDRDARHAARALLERAVLADGERRYESEAC